MFGVFATRELFVDVRSCGVHARFQTRREVIHPRGTSLMSRSPRSATRGVQAARKTGNDVAKCDECKTQQFGRPHLGCEQISD